MLRAHRRAHRLIWRLAAALIPVILGLGWYARPSPTLPAPERLSTRGDP